MSTDGTSNTPAPPAGGASSEPGDDGGRSPGRMSRLRRPSTLASILALALAGSAVGVAVSGGDSSAPTVTTQTASPPAPGQAKAVASTQASGLSAEAVYARAQGGVVDVAAAGATGQTPFGSQEASALGTGFVLDEQGHIVTNYHVIASADPVTVTFANGDEVEDAIQTDAALNSGNSGSSTPRAAWWG